MEAPGTLLVADAGVHPNGFGRLMRIDLSDHKLDALAGGWRGLGSLAYLPARRLVLLTQVGPWPRGCAFSLAIDEPDRPSQFAWQGLNHPSQLSVDPDDDEVLISTGDGVVHLELG
jgi:hypothetical protein